MNTRKIANDFGLRVTHTNNKNIDYVAKKFDIKKSDLLENAFVINDEDIVLGIYEDSKLKQAAFFHEIGHTLVSGSYEKLVQNDEMLIEFQAWVEGLKIAKKYGHEFSNKTFRYILKSVNSYYRHALNAYNTKK
jgi:hypothetical protein